MASEQRTSESFKQKISRIHDTFPHAKKEHIGIILQCYNESKAIDAITRDGGHDVAETGNRYVAETGNLKNKIPLQRNFLSNSDNMEANIDCEQICKDIFSMYQNGIFSDVTLRCGQRVFKAHKSILSARSSVFEALILSDSKESRENCLEIHNIDSHVLEAMLEYIYGGGIDDKMSVSTARELLAASDLYQLPGLKRVCMHVLESSLKVDNVECCT